MKIINNLEKRLKDASEKISDIHPNINAIVLFGSRARRDYRKDSDYDISIFCKGKEDRKLIQEFHDIFQDIELETAQINKKEFNLLKKRHHSFLYCIFRDGKVLYQKQRWFDERKPEILKLEPKKETALEYIKNSSVVLDLTKTLDYDFEEGKIATNLLGFGVLMFNKIYPLSPHSLPIQLKHLGFYKIGKIIRYVQDRYYKNRMERKTKKYISSIKSLKAFAKKFLQKVQKT